MHDRGIKVKCHVASLDACGSDLFRRLGLIGAPHNDKWPNAASQTAASHDDSLLARNQCGILRLQGLSATIFCLALILTQNGISAP
jgi:hypothetical protein